MPIHYSEYYKVDHSEFVNRGVYDGFLDKDSLLHVDPLYLKNCIEAEFVDAYNAFLSHFNKLVHLVPFVKYLDVKQDRFFNKMYQLMVFPELPNSGLGFSKEGTDGNGISGNLSIQLAESAFEIIQAGLKDPEIFALMQLFEDEMGADRISDMTLYIIEPYVLKYTERIARELDIPVKEVSVRDHDYLVPVYKGLPVHFLPTSILADLPVAKDFDDVDRVVGYYNRLKRRVAEAIGINWKDYTKFKKPEWKRLVINNKECYNAAIEFFRKAGSVPYDFDIDSLGEYDDLRLKTFALSSPLNLSCFFTRKKEDSVYNATKRILEQYKSLIENNQMWRLFNRKGRTPDETDWQLYLFSIAKIYIESNKIDMLVTRENNEGAGELDFMFSKGKEGLTIVEIKRAYSNRLIHALTVQLPQYMKADSAKYGIFVVIWEKDENKGNIDALFATIEDMKNNGEYVPDVMVIDARIKGSGSVA